MILTDTHTHLYSEEFKEDSEMLINKAIEQGVQRFFLPNVDSRTIEGMYLIENIFPHNCFAMMGLHPCSVGADYEKELAIVEQELNKRKFVAIGEIGIDLYWDKTFIKEQLIAFKTQANWATQKNIPIAIHCRNAFDELYQALLELTTHNSQLPTLKGVFHCFSGNLEQAKKIIDLGLMLGIGGVVTFKNSGLAEIVSEIDMQHLLLETDAPYLAPAPFRGKRNLPEYLKLVAQKVAEVKGISIEEVAKITTENSLTLFGR